MKLGPPYTCKSLRPSDGNNPVETSNERYVPKTYTFDVSKCDEIYDLLVADGQVVAHKGVKIPPLEQRQKRGFCKYHNFLGHNTSQCSLFRDLVQKGLNEGRLKFGNKPKPQMQVDYDPLEDTSIIGTNISSCNVVKAEAGIAAYHVAVVNRNSEGNKEPSMDTTLEQSSWNKITADLAENEVKKALEVEL